MASGRGLSTSLRKVPQPGIEPGTTRCRKHGHTTRPRELRQQLGSGVGLVQFSQFSLNHRAQDFQWKFSMGTRYRRSGLDHVR